MDTQRFVLLFVFMFPVFMLLDAWQRDQQPVTPPPAAQSNGGTPVPAVPSAPATDKVAVPPGATAATAPRVEEKDATIKVETDLVTAQISTRGGDLRRLELKAHRDTLDK